MLVTLPPWADYAVGMSDCDISDSDSRSSRSERAICDIDRSDPGAVQQWQIRRRS
jgi:hypothetical protein